jgi:hypothetical protein
MMFDLRAVPSETPADWARAANIGISRLQARKVGAIPINESSQLRLCCRWVTIYTQAQIRRGLSLIQGGIDAVNDGHTLVGALCARAVLEDAALLWCFNRDVEPLLDKRDTLGLDALVYPRALATRDPKEIKRHGEELRARNILTAIDKITLSHPNVRLAYDELSEVCHPNSLGVLWHFTDVIDEQSAVFDDGHRMVKNALHYLVFCGLIFVAEEGPIARIHTKAAAILEDPTTA